MMKEKQLKQEYITPKVAFEEIEADCMQNTWSVDKPGGTEDEQPLSIETEYDWQLN